MSRYGQASALLTNPTMQDTDMESHSKQVKTGSTHHALSSAACAEPQVLWTRAAGTRPWRAAAVCLARLALAALRAGRIVAAERLAAASSAGARPLPLQAGTAVAGLWDAGAARAAGFALAVALRIGWVVAAVGLQGGGEPRFASGSGRQGGPEPVQSCGYSASENEASTHAPLLQQQVEHRVPAAAFAPNRSPRTAPRCRCPPTCHLGLCGRGPPAARSCRRPGTPRSGCTEG